MRRSTLRICARLAAIVPVLLLGGCGGGGGGSTKPAPAAQGDFLIVDLDTGAVAAAGSAQLGDAAWRTNRVLFRRIPAGTLQPENPGALGKELGEVTAATPVASFYVGVFELTQGQWMRIAGASDRPWTAVTPAGTVGDRATDDARPATALIHDELTLRLAAWNTAKAAMLGGRSLRLPTDAQWEWAARGGNAGLFAWGDSLDRAVAASFAVCAETAGGVPERVGQRNANGFGLFDVHGNAREWVLDPDGSGLGQPQLRGGGWGDSLLRCRAANRMPGVDRTLYHAYSGARLVLSVP